MPPKDSVPTLCSASSEGDECYTECPAVADAPSDTSCTSTGQVHVRSLSTGKTPYSQHMYMYYRVGGVPSMA